MRLPHRVVPCSLLAMLVPLALATVACSGGGSTPQLSGDSSARVAFDDPATRVLRPKRGAAQIQHVVIIMQENESFDHLFNGYPGANTVQSGKTHTGAVVPLTVQNLGDATNTSHYAADFLVNCDGGWKKGKCKMDGFDLNTNNPKPNMLAYTYIDPTQIQPYYQMAQQYVLGDNFFTSHIDASLIAHQYIVAAQANHAVNLPTGAWGCSGGPSDLIPTLNADRSTGNYQQVCFNYTTLADELDSAGLSWRYYAPCPTCSGGSWSSFLANNQIYNGPDWATKVINPETQILTDIPNGTLANVTWVVPSDCNSDHPGSKNGNCSNPGGPSWVASIVNAVGQSQFWNSTIIFVLWDEWGGEYDHVPPPYKDFDGLGFRVPLLCISPYAYAGVVNKTQLEAASIPKYVEQTFGLNTLAAADKRATPADSGCINPSQSKARTFKPIAAPLDARYFLHVQRRSNAPPDPD